MRTAFIQAICSLAEQDARIWLLTGDLGFSVLEEFARRFPDRFVNVGVAEQNLIGVAAGLARCGKVPFVYSIANFPTFRCLEQIRNDVCYHEANVKIVAVGGGFTYGPQGFTHHGIEDLAILRALPGMVVVAPGDPVEAKLATHAMAAWDGPCYLRLGKAGEPVVHVTEPQFELGRAIQVRDGRDLAILATGGMLAESMRVARELEQSGIGARVLSMHTLKPLDERAVLAAARRTGALLTVEEHRRTGGLASAIADVLVEAGIALPRFRAFAVPDELSHAVGSQQFLRQQAGDLLDIARTLVRRRQAA